MPIHDWTRVDAGTFHGFHTAWVTHLSETLNGGLLPTGYYALPEQHGSRFIADVLTLQAPISTATPKGGGGLAVLDTPPRMKRHELMSPGSRRTRRTLTVRHVSGHRIIAMIEIVSPANKDRQTHVDEFVDKVESVLSHGIHVLLADLLPPRGHDPQGMHAAICARFEEPYELPADQPLTLASYVADTRTTAYVEHLAVGSTLPDVPLFLDPDFYINVPLETTYMAAYRGMPAYWRDVVEGRTQG